MVNKYALRTIVGAALLVLMGIFIEIGEWFIGMLVTDPVQLMFVTMTYVLIGILSYWIGFFAMREIQK